MGCFVGATMPPGEMESFDKPRLSQQILEIEDVDTPETMPTTATFLWLGEVVHIFEGHV